MNKYKIADVIVEVTNHSEFSQKLMADYEYNGHQPVDLTIKSFEKITKFFSDIPNHIFSDPNYYKAALSGENEAAQRLHAMLTKYLTCKDVKDKTILFSVVLVLNCKDPLMVLSSKLTYGNRLRTIMPAVGSIYSI